MPNDRIHIFVVKAASSPDDTYPNIAPAEHTGFTLKSLDPHNNFTIDGQELGVDILVGDWILLKNQTNAEQNGMWYVKQIANSMLSIPWILTRKDPAGTLRRDQLFYVKCGECQEGDLWRLTNADPVTAGATELNFVQIPLGGNPLLAGELCERKVGEGICITGKGDEPGKLLLDELCEKVEDEGVCVTGLGSTPNGRLVLDTLKEKTEGNGICIEGAAESEPVGKLVLDEIVAKDTQVLVEEVVFEDTKVKGVMCGNVEIIPDSDAGLLASADAPGSPKALSLEHHISIINVPNNDGVTYYVNLGAAQEGQQKVVHRGNDSDGGLVLQSTGSNDYTFPDLDSSCLMIFINGRWNHYSCINNAAEIIV